jgi:hypothetical protein
MGNTGDGKQWVMAAVEIASVGVAQSDSGVVFDT